MHDFASDEQEVSADNGGTARLRRDQSQEGRNDLPLPPPRWAPIRGARCEEGATLLRHPLRRRGHRVVPSLLPDAEVEGRAEDHNWGGYPLSGSPPSPRKDGAGDPAGPD